MSTRTRRTDPGARTSVVFGSEERARRFLRQAQDLLGVDIDGTDRSTAAYRSFARSADPDAAALRLLQVIESQVAAGRKDRATELLADHAVLDRLVVVLGASEALCSHLEKWPDALDLLAAGARQDALQSADPAPEAPAEGALGSAGHLPGGESHREALLRAVGADPAAADPVAATSGPAGVQAMRRAYRDRLTVVAARDLCHPEPQTIVDEVSVELSDLAAAALESGLAVARAEIDPEHRVRLAVIAMGKCGARELNYVSDVDVVYCWEPTAGEPDEEKTELATRLALRLQETTSAFGQDSALTELPLWELDPALRPEGKAGPLVRTFSEFQHYYARIAENWEFQALLKARPVAGDMDLGNDWWEALGPLVWRASEREGFIEQARAMRRRVVDTIPPKEAERQIKLGVGGLRDVEFSAQILQLVHGHDDPDIRVRATLGALATLGEKGYVSTSDTVEFDEAYRFLRVVEHRLQIPRMQRTALLPTHDEKLRVLARSVYSSGDRSGQRLVEEREHRAVRVRTLHESIFYRPVLEAAAGHEYDRLSPGAARERLRAFGYADPQAAMGHIQALTAGVSRVSTVQKQVLPALLDWFSEGVDPDAALLSFRRLTAALDSNGWFLRLLRDSGYAATSLARILSLSRFASSLLERNPSAVSWLDDQSLLAPREDAVLDREVESLLTRHGGDAVPALRAAYSREVLRTAMGEILGVVDRAETPGLLSRAMDRTIDGALRAVRTRLDCQAAEAGKPVPSYEFMVVAMGRLGGQEIGYFSDADVMYVYRPHEDLGVDDRARLAAHAKKVAMTLAADLGAAGTSQAIELDADLRPEGKQGPLARTFEGYRAYYSRWSEPWEAQALLRARPVAGYRPLVEDFLGLVDPLRYPETVPEASVRQMRKLKARMETERLPRGADPRTHIKLGRGGLSDVEWCAQLIQLRHAHEHPEMRTTRTLPVLDHAAAVGLLDPEDRDVLSRAWTLATEVRAAVMLYRGRTAESLPVDVHELEATARLMGYEPGGARELREDYLQATRRARVVMERVFFGFE
ncbi:bifunctional [glutamine synthetase] adenylyltransferase/[glutamine synthetase]-adenylyl-L-tyrosine phosphorylase [Brevibacterium litoralis]|uniref:bifunctional [glutamine synthetase] adenylyltransferase/[glutamine synthetase]-adenylyl-L-tyrosine phosphorylase n=1 Tax=Brevibacterium litoralis TaxID=3138935 RepID=UPI0032ED7600